MTAEELMTELIGKENYGSDWTVDKCKYGDPGVEVRRVATCLTATPEVLRAAKEYGADLLITHEPTYYEHTDKLGDDPDPITKAKIAEVERAGITIYRFHDFMHFSKPDKISAAFLETMGWHGEFDGVMGFTLDHTMSPLEMAKEIEEKLGLAHVRIIGCRTGNVSKCVLALGHRGDDAWLPFKSNDTEVAICGEFCEWHDGEVTRDAAQMGMQKTILILGHAGSERDGMRVLADTIMGAHPDITAKYIECGELYTYTH